MKSPKQNQPQRKIVGVPLPVETLKQIDAIADTEGRPRANLIRQLVIEALEYRGKKQPKGQ